MAVQAATSKPLPEALPFAEADDPLFFLPHMASDALEVALEVALVTLVTAPFFLAAAAEVVEPEEEPAAVPRLTMVDRREEVAPHERISSRT
jgi:hypothetical protein